MIPLKDPTDKPIPVNFFNEDISFVLTDEFAITQWIKRVVVLEDKTLQNINIIFCSDTYLHQLNIQYLNHNTLTDVITFPYNTPPIIEGDIFISIDRVKENALSFSSSATQELYRVIIHGVLHLCGYGDKTEEEKIKMTQKENEALLLLKEFLPS